MTKVNLCEQQRKYTTRIPLVGEAKMLLLETCERGEVMALVAPDALCRFRTTKRKACCIPLSAAQQHPQWLQP